MANRRSLSPTPSDTSTRGGADFDELCRGTVRPYYTFNTVDLTGKRDAAQIEKLLDKQLERSIDDLQFHSGRLITTFYIGKAYVKKMKKRQFHPNDYTTWIKTDISACWQNVKGTQRHGKCYNDGMVVLGLVTRDNLPKSYNGNQENLATDLVRGLLRKNKLAIVFDRSEITGKLSSSLHIGYVIYMAFGYEKP